MDAYFAKTSTVYFSLAAEVDRAKLVKPFAIILKKENALVRNYTDGAKPPVSYRGMVTYPYKLGIDELTSGEYVLVKLENLN